MGARRVGATSCEQHREKTRLDTLLGRHFHSFRRAEYGANEVRSKEPANPLTETVVDGSYGLDLVLSGQTGQEAAAYVKTV
jgi:hypothetical protein